MSYSDFLILLIIVLGLIAKSTVISTAGAVLIILKAFNMPRVISFIERYSLFIGLVFLMISILLPFTKSVDLKNILVNTFITPLGILAIAAGLIATNLNGEGLSLLNQKPELIFGILIGSIVGIIFFKGIPVGPLMAGGIMVLVLDILKLFKIH